MVLRALHRVKVRNQKSRKISMFRVQGVQAEVSSVSKRLRQELLATHVGHFPSSKAHSPSQPPLLCSCREQLDLLDMTFPSIRHPRIIRRTIVFTYWYEELWSIRFALRPLRRLSACKLVEQNSSVCLHTRKSRVRMASHFCIQFPP